MNQGRLNHAMVLRWLNIQMVYCSTSVCSNGILQHECVLELYIAAQVCAQMVYCSMSVCSNCILQHECVLKWYTVARVCAQTGHCSMSVCANKNRQQFCKFFLVDAHSVRSPGYVCMVDQVCFI